ncbi:MAG: hypothetical protein Q8P18_22925 [Pseudomonadota bacterium]|nr:hypothetical protein [Pseudomonadota bacterium]
MSHTVAAPGISGGWLRGRDFDLGMIGGVLLLALGLGWLANTGASWFALVLWADFWFIAYPHVASMWTRVVFDRASARRHWFLWAGLPPLVLLGTASLAHLGGALVLNTLYYHWQSYHYTRQSYGIARVYQRTGGATERDWLTDAVVFAFPIWGWLHRCAQGSTNFFGGPLSLPAVPAAVANSVGALAVLLLGVWVARTRWDRPAHAWFVLSHVLLTFVSYIAVTEITRGWIFVNIWHNAQYLLFVWARNTRRFEGRADTHPLSVAWLCQPRNWVAYSAVCLALSTVGFGLLRVSAEGMAVWGIGAGLVLHQALNFHHYIVDAVIWRSPRGALIASPAGAGRQALSGRVGDGP